MTLQSNVTPREQDLLAKNEIKTLIQDGNKVVDYSHASLNLLFKSIEMYFWY